MGELTPIQKWMPTICVVLVVVLLIFSLADIYRVKTFRKEALVAEGTVIENNASFRVSGVSGYRGARSHHKNRDCPIIEFFTQDGQRIEFSSSMCGNLTPEVGSRIEVLYNKSSPNNAKLKGFAEYGFSGIGLPLAIFLSVVGYCSRRFNRSMGH